jgi:transcriptional regulator
MYVPGHFAESRTPVLHALMRAHPLATLVTWDGGAVDANHVPLEIVEDGALGVLRGHVARGNPVWKRHRADVEAMAIFQGADAYITPSDYATKRETGKVVPTWNYAVVHAHGPLRVIEDAAWLRALLERLTDRHEAELPGGATWKVSDAPDDFIAGLLHAIVGIEIPIARLEGKWKVSQNRSAADREGVATGLARRGGEAMAALVRGT